MSLAAGMTACRTSRSTSQQNESGRQLPGHQTIIEIITAVDRPAVKLLNPPVDRIQLSTPCMQHITWQKQRQDTGIQHTGIRAPCLQYKLLLGGFSVSVMGPAQQKLAHAASPQEHHVCCPLPSAAPAGCPAAAAQQPAGPAALLRGPCTGTLLCHGCSICQLCASSKGSLLSMAGTAACGFSRSP